MSDLTKSIWIDAPPETVFDYFTDPDKVARWCGARAELDPTPDGLYRVDLGKAGVMEGRFLRVERPSFLAWEVGPAGEPAAARSVIEVSIAPEAGGSRVDVRQTGLATPFDTAAGRGWDHHLARLSVAATGGTPSDDSICERSMESLT